MTGWFEWLSLCSLFGHRWERVEIVERYPFPDRPYCLTARRCRRCGLVPNRPLGNVEFCYPVAEARAGEERTRAEDP